MGNSRARAVYEANLPDHFRRPQTDSSLEAFIRAKYEHKKYIAREWVPPQKPQFKMPSLEKLEIDKKPASKSKSNGTSTKISLPKPTSTTASSINNVKPIPATVTSSASADLLSLDNPTSENNDFGDFLGIGSNSNSYSSGDKKNVTDVQSIKNSDDLSDLFPTTAKLTDSKTDSNKMSTKDILALYGAGSTATPSMQQQQQQPNMFGSNQNMSFSNGGQQQNYGMSMGNNFAPQQVQGNFYQQQQPGFQQQQYNNNIAGNNNQAGSNGFLMQQTQQQNQPQQAQSRMYSQNEMMSTPFQTQGHFSNSQMISGQTTLANNLWQ